MSIPALWLAVWREHLWPSNTVRSFLVALHLSMNAITSVVVSSHRSLASRFGQDVVASSNTWSRNPLALEIRGGDSAAAPAVRTRKVALREAEHLPSNGWVEIVRLQDSHSAP